ncbi:MAG: DUF1573 domain-containing protein [Dysgonamonadaceae bacterium]
MKKFAFILLTMCLSVSFAMAQKPGPAAKFDKTIFDFGKVQEKVGKVSTEFTVINAGNAPLIINRVQTSCGCTTPEYTTAPILPGKKGVIKITYSTTGRVYTFNKKITVFTNVPDSVYTLTIKGEVIN